MPTSTSGEMTAGSDDARFAVAERLLETQRSSHESLLATWKYLEGKAQVAAGISGGFVGAVFAFIRGAGEGTTAGQRQLLALALGLLALAVLCAVAALTVRQLPGRPYDAAAQGLSDLLRLEEGEDIKTRHQALLQQETRAWQEVCDALRKGNGAKAGLVRASQSFLGSAILIVVVLSTWVLFGS